MTATKPLTTMKARSTAIEMHEGGWKYTEIQRYLADRGVSAARNTIRRWVDPHYEEQQRIRVRDAMRRRRRSDTDARLGGTHHTAEFRLTRMRALRDAGMSYDAVAKAMRVDYGDVMTDGQARYALQVGRYPRTLAA